MIDCFLFRSSDYHSCIRGLFKMQHLKKQSVLSAALEERQPMGRREGDGERLCFRGSHSTFLLNHPLSLPCLLFLIVRAALQYFYQMISPSSSAALMFMKMILHRNASCMPRCHCLSSSLASTCMYVCVWGREREVVVVVVLVVVGVSWCHNRLTSFIYNYAGARVCVWGCVY